MRCRQVRRCVAIASLLTVQAFVAHTALTAQFAAERPYAAVMKLPSLVFEVWPADFNGDGISDLVAGRPGGEIVVRVGRGDGTFEDEQLVATALGMPIGVGDLNHDDVVDIIASEILGGSLTTSILPGHGDGTFGVPIETGVAVGAPAYVVDVDGDGTRDLLGLGIDTVRVYPGHRDFTFGTPTVLPTRLLAQNMIPADLNGDGLIDVAAVTREGRSVDVFLNLGAFTFTGSTIPLGRHGLGISARDMNNDGITDLIASGGDLAAAVAAPHWLSGFVFILLGNGDGTFQGPLTFVTNNGPRSAVVGDFNGDGLPDVATGNLSYAYACEGTNHLWDSVSILPGSGDGRLGPAASYALGSTDDIPDLNLYRRAHHRLNTSDLNADGRTDLIASPGAILLSTSASENRSPVADAGHPQAVPGDESITLAGTASDPDHDWLTFEWTDETGLVVGTVPRPCLGRRSGTQTFTLTVTDGRGGVSIDTVTHTFGAGQPLPDGWSSNDIGDATGHASSDGTTYSVTGSGSDIWGTSDAFHYVNAVVAGNFDVAVRVTSVEPVHEWTKAGLMLRDGLSPDARHAFIFSTPPSTQGVAFQRREVTGGVTVHTSGPAAGPPVWVRLRRDGDVVTAFARSSASEPWVRVGTQTFSALPRSLHLGLAVTSHLVGVSATATFDNLTVQPLTGTLPAGWTSGDIGVVAPPGPTTYDGGTFVVSGSGADIWGASDGFQYVYRAIAGDFDVMARVLSLDDRHAWTKAGLMMRDGLSPQAAHASVFVTPTNGVAFQRRDFFSAASLHTGGPAVGAPVWLRLRRQGAAVEAFARVSNEEPWTHIGTQTFERLPASVLIGLAVTSHLDGTLATAVFDHLDGLPDSEGAWTSGDVGPPGLPGSTTSDGAAYTLLASGHDIWGSSDAFRFMFQPLSGDGTVTARVASLEALHRWSKAGVMIRASTAPSSAHAFMFVSLSEGFAFQRRLDDGGVTAHTGGGTAGAPYWVRLARAGDMITASASADGITWTEVGRDRFPSMPRDVLAGLAVTSHDDTALAAATFDTLSVQYTTPVRRGLAVITDFRNRRLEDLAGAGLKSEAEVAVMLRQMEDHWAFLSRGLETITWDIIRIELPYDVSVADPDPFDGDWSAFRNAAAAAIRQQVATADYDVDGDNEIDAAWLIVSNGGLEIASALGGSSVNLNVNMFVDGQQSVSVTAGAIGNFNHELAHLLGLRDTYGIYDTLHGLTLMSYPWPVPPHDFSAFERVSLGWVQPRIMTQTTRGVWLPSAHDALAAVMIPTQRGDEYFLLEYRRRPDSGYGSAYVLPYNGLVVLHVFEGSDNGSDPPLVRLEPADGRNTFDGVLHADDFVSPDNPALLSPLVVRSYFGDRPEIFRIENVVWRDGGIAFDVVIPD